MAGNLDIRENQMEQRTAAYLRCIDSAGNSGLIDANTFKRTDYRFIQKGVAGGNPEQWIGLGTFQTDPYYPARINISFGNYHIPSSRKILDITFSGHTANFYAAGNGENVVGYVLRGSNIVDLYIKLSSTQIAVGWVYGLAIQDLAKTTTEPNGIVYVP